MRINTKHFLTLLDLTKDELLALVHNANFLKTNRHEEHLRDLLHGKVLAMFFEKSSTRTRVSFEAGMSQLGGSALFLSTKDTQFGRGEPIRDAARVISSMVDIVMMRTFEQVDIEEFAEHSSVPVINGLSDDFHPCQLLADIQTFMEYRGTLEGKTVAWIGDGNNMCQSWIHASMLLDFELKIACPEGFEPNPHLVRVAKDRITISQSPREAARGADLVTTDVFASMGQEEQRKIRLEQFSDFQVDHDLMSLAAEGALFMHCLPAHRDEEVTEELLEDKSISVVWDEAENRLHAQKALLLFLLQVTNFN
ncbi:MAG: ornithine carbamoyltransferase [Cellvibrionales bacterium TMED49]|nr:MAG: ornithine carbamoyltransferase [Cellvibrionales bacterium TMED49]|tara:strand:- start:292 stop:1218 length:927 start_codon:yes stop_codon:yes gene_type:complete